MSWLSGARDMVNRWAYDDRERRRDRRIGAVMDKPVKKPSGPPPFGKPVESSDFAAGVAAGALMERQRIVALLKTNEARRTCGCTGVWRVADKLAAGGWSSPPTNQTPARESDA